MIFLIVTWIEGWEGFWELSFLGFEVVGILVFARLEDGASFRGVVRLGDTRRDYRSVLKSFGEFCGF